jgi:ribosome-associated protein
MEDLTIKPGLTIPGDDLELSTARSGGPGGQHVNRTNSKVVIKLDLVACRVFTEQQRTRLRQKIPPRFLAQDKTLLIVSSEQERDQARNREDARAKLAQVIRKALTKPKRRVKTKPTRGSKERRLKTKKEQSSKKKDRRQRWD